MKNHLKYIIIFFLFTSVLFSEENIYNVKGIFIEKFCPFTEWSKAKMDTSEVFTITIIGENNFGNILENMYADILIKGKEVKINYVKSIDEIKNTHILFISNDQKYNIDKIVSFANKNNILTISDSQNFGKKGVHINFYLTVNGTLHFTINLKSTKEANLRINLMLIEIAKII